MDTIDARLSECFKLVFPDTPADKIRDLSTESATQWDSVAAITLVTVLEEEFGLRIDLEEMSELDSYSRIFAYIRQHSQS